MARAFDPPPRGRRDVLTTDHPKDAVKPTPKRLRYLRTLADRAGQTFTHPQTAAQASAEIQRLQGQTPTPPADRHREKRAVQRDMATGRGDAAQVRAAETTGYGSTAHWAHKDDQAVDEPTTTVKRAGPRTKLATYTAGGQARSWSVSASPGSPALSTCPPATTAACTS